MWRIAQLKSGSFLSELEGQNFKRQEGNAGLFLSLVLCALKFHWGVSADLCMKQRFPCSRKFQSMSRMEEKSDLIEEWIETWYQMKQNGNMKTASILLWAHLFRSKQIPTPGDSYDRHEAQSSHTHEVEAVKAIFIRQAIPDHTNSGKSY